MKVRGLSGKRPQGFATGDIVRLLDGQVGRVTGARASGSQKVRINGKDFSVATRKLTLLERSNGYDFDGGGFSSSMKHR